VRGPEIPRTNTMSYIKRWFTLADLAVTWMSTLAKEGLSTVKPDVNHLAKESKEKNPRALLRTAEAVPVQLANNQTVWVQPGGAIREEFGYQSVRVFDAPSRNDMAIIAALTVTDSHLITPSTRVRKTSSLGEAVRNDSAYAPFSLPCRKIRSDVVRTSSTCS
jgi:hypothetical protein